MNAGTELVIGLVFLPFLLASIVIASPLFGFAWSPFAVVIGALIANRRNKNVRRAVLMSAVYSILSIHLWLLFALRMWGKNVSGKCLSCAYVYAFAVWIVLIVALSVSEFVGRDTTTVEVSDTSIVVIEDTSDTPRAVFVATLLTGALAWTVSLRRTLRVRGSNSRVGTDPATAFADGETISYVFAPLSPFVFSTVWMYALLFYFISYEEFDWLNWWLVLPTAGSLLWIFWPSGPWIPQRIRTLFRGDLF